MNGAVQYSSLRTRVDALYRYHVNKRCSQIDLTVLLGLAGRGQSLAAMPACSVNKLRQHLATQSTQLEAA